MTESENRNSEIEGLCQRKLGPQPTKWDASGKNPDLLPKEDALEETGAPKEAVTLEEVLPRKAQQQEPQTDVTRPNPKRRRTTFLDELPPADVPFLEQSTPRKTAVFKELLSKNGASMEEAFAVCHMREEESTPEKAAVFSRATSRRAASDDSAPKDYVKQGDPPTRKTTTSRRPTPNPIGRLKKLTSKTESAVRKMIGPAQSSKSDDDIKVDDDDGVKPAVPEERTKISANHDEAKAADKKEEGEEMDVEEKATDLNTGDAQSRPVAGDVHPPSVASCGCSTPDRLVIVEDPEMLSQNVGGAQTPRKDSCPPSEILSVTGTPDRRRMASGSEALNRNVCCAEMAKGDSHLPRVATSGWSTDGRVCAINEEDKEKEGDEDDGENGSSISLEDGEIRDDSSTEPSDHESSYLWPATYIYPSTSRCRGYLVNPFQNYRTGAVQSTSSSSRDSCDAASSSSSNGTSTILSARALSPSGFVLPSKQFSTELIDRLKNLQLSGFGKPDLPPHSPSSAGDSNPDASRRDEYTNCVERKIPKRKSSKPSDIYFRRASPKNDSNHSD